jgi:NADH-quinone oxidoreductase subunit I
MFGLGIAKGLGVTLKHFFMTYWEDLQFLLKGYDRQTVQAKRQSAQGHGIFTVNYPEEKLPIPEHYRFVPFLIYDEEDGERKIRCTACGICAKVCPSQCIWIVRTRGPDGKPKPEPAEFYIDIGTCMNCGSCAEFCPFDSIKMDHNYEQATYEREVSHIHDLEKLLKPASYWHSIAPKTAAAEEEARAAKKKKKE